MEGVGLQFLSNVTSFFLVRMIGEKYIEFTSRSTKTFKGGLAYKELHNKQIRQYSQPGKSPPHS
jgi:hypothetical protein